HRGDPDGFGLDRIHRITRWRADPVDLGGDSAIRASCPAGGARFAAGRGQAGAFRLIRRPDAIRRPAAGAAPSGPELRHRRRSGGEPETRTIVRCRCRVRLIRSLPMTTPIAEQGTDLHNQRLAQIDALIPAAPAPAPADGDIVIEVPGAIGLARTRRIDPNTLDACWGALTRQLLASPRVFGDDPGAAMSALLDSWGAWVRSQPPEPDTSAVVSWPSRDTSVIAAFLDRGLAPRVVLAARPGGRPTPPPT